jgi:hypothetical protein
LSDQHVIPTKNPARQRSGTGWNDLFSGIFLGDSPPCARNLEQIGAISLYRDSTKVQAGFSGICVLSDGQVKISMEPLILVRFLLVFGAKSV